MVAKTRQDKKETSDAQEDEQDLSKSYRCVLSLPILLFLLHHDPGIAPSHASAAAAVAPSLSILLLALVARHLQERLFLLFIPFLGWPPRVLFTISQIVAIIEPCRHQRRTLLAMGGGLLLLCCSSSPAQSASLTYPPHHHHSRRLSIHSIYTTASWALLGN